MKDLLTENEFCRRGFGSVLVFSLVDKVESQRMCCLRLLNNLLADWESCLFSQNQLLTREGRFYLKGLR
jgi:hypothetical protein